MPAFDLPLLPLPPYDGEPPFISDIEHLNLMRQVVKTTNTLNELHQLRAQIPTNLASVYKLTESVQSTRIEGTQATFAEVMEVEAIHKVDENEDVREVVNYQNALDLGISTCIENDYPLTTSLLKLIHEKILYKSRGASRSPGEFRKNQNWIGRGNGGIENAEYIPPIATRVPELMGNLDKFINEPNDKFHPLLMAGIIHAQFESIHPFLDGNGRVGRLLISLFLLKKKVCGNNIIFVSEELERNKFKYYSLLNNLRTQKPKWFEWLDFFLTSIEKQANKDIQQANRIMALMNYYMISDKIYENMTVRKIFYFILSKPIFTSKMIQEYHGYSNATVNKWLRYFVELGLIYPDNKKRNTLYRCYELLDILHH